MAIERNQSSDPVRSKPRDADPRVQDQAPRQPPSLEKVDEFRSLMQGKDGRQSGQSALLRDAARKDGQLLSAQAGDDKAQANEAASAQVKDQAVQRVEERGEKADALPPADVSLLWQAQMAMRDAPTPASAPTAVNTTAFSELIERHVRQLAIGGGPDGDGKVLLRLADTTLPGTDLLLSRTEGGWLLRADVRSRNSFDAIGDAAQALSERFATRNLGTLTIDAHFNE